jgi:hypothetical protein
MSTPMRRTRSGCCARAASGQATAAAPMIFFDVTEPSQIVAAVEPFFLNLNAAVELVPVMNGDDLRKGLAKASQK